MYRRGASSLFVPIGWAMREPLFRGTSNRHSLHVFFVYGCIESNQDFRRLNRREIEEAGELDMHLKEKESNVKCAIGIGIIISVVILIILGCRYRFYYPQCGEDINADITSSFGSILGATLTPLWSIVATYIYYKTLKIQAKELRNSQEIGFSQNLNTLITYSKEVLNDISIKPYNLPIYEGKEAMLFLYVSLKYTYCIMKSDNINSIPDFGKYVEDNEESDYARFLDEIKLYEYEMDLLRRDNPEEYRKLKKEELFNKYKPYFTFLFELSNKDTNWRNTSDAEYNHIKHAFEKVWMKYGHKVDAYFQGIESAINYIWESDHSMHEKRNYALWITTNLSQITLLFFNYYLFCQRDEKEYIISRCKKFAFFSRIDKTKLIDNNINYLIK